jgi:molybdate transport system permease protein
LGTPRSPAVLVAFAVAGAALLVAPLLGLLWEAPWGAIVSHLTAPDVMTAARLSLQCSVTATGLSLLFGVPLAWLLVRTQFPGRSLLRALTTLPVVLPPVVGGVALLLAFGRNGLLGGVLYDVFGISLAFTTAGAILAETFVAMPFMVLTMCGALESMDRGIEGAARTLGARFWTVFWRVTLPMLRPSLIAGSVLCWARALGEFGATITFAGNLPGTTQTLPLAVYLALETDTGAAIAMSLVLLAVSTVILVSMRQRWLGAL